MQEKNKGYIQKKEEIKKQIIYKKIKEKKKKEKFYIEKGKRDEWLYMKK